VTRLTDASAAAWASCMNAAAVQHRHSANLGVDTTAVRDRAAQLDFVAAALDFTVFVQLPTLPQTNRRGRPRPNLEGELLLPRWRESLNLPRLTGVDARGDSRLKRPRSSGTTCSVAPISDFPLTITVTRADSFRFAVPCRNGSPVVSCANSGIALDKKSARISNDKESLKVRSQ